jgi:anti-anti-sigma factor
MQEKHTAVTADASRRAVVREPGKPAVGGLAVRRERRADMLVLWLSGTLDRATSGLLDREFDAQAGRVTRLVIDLTGLEFMDSCGLDTLVRAHRRASENDQRLSIRQGPRVAQRLLELTRDAQRVLGRRLTARTRPTTDRLRARHAVR